MNEYMWCLTSIIYPLRKVIVTGGCETCCWMGGSNAVVCHVGVSIEGEEKKRVKGVTSALCEIWDRAIIQSFPLPIKEENHENRRGHSSRETATSGEVVRKRTFASFRITRGQFACTLCAPQCARACVCLQVPETREERRIEPRKEGWWIIQAAARHKWWVPVPVGVRLHSSNLRRATDAVRPPRSYAGELASITLP